MRITNNTRTAAEYFETHGVKIKLQLKASVWETDHILHDEEQVIFAMVGAFANDNADTEGVISVTTHRFLCCNCINNHPIHISLPYAQSIEIGPISGALRKKVSIRSANTEVIVYGSPKELTELTETLLSAIKDSINQTSIEITSGIEGVSIHQQNQLRKAEAKQAAPSAPLSKKEQTKQRIAENKAAGIACCPKCGSTSLSANKKGFGFKKAVAGAIVAGPVGIVGGSIGANKLEITCLNCGHKFKPGE